MDNGKSDKTERVRLVLSGNVLSHISLDLYKEPVDVIAEYIANAWDADATKVEISRENDSDGFPGIIIKDNGIGMTKDECKSKFLSTNPDKKRGNKEKTSEKGRRFLGRKAIGKFAAFGISRYIEIKTVSGKTGEKTRMDMDYDNIINSHHDTYVEVTKENTDVNETQGTTLKFGHLNDYAKENLNPDDWVESLKERFLIHEGEEDFEIFVGDTKLSPADYSENAALVFPRDYKSGEKPAGLKILDNGWAEEEICDRYSGKSQKISWQIIFKNKPIKRPGLKGISVLCRRRRAQEPFFFGKDPNSDNGYAYLCGRVQADFLDDNEFEEAIATARQRIKWDTDTAKPLHEWGSKKLGELIRLKRGNAPNPPPPPQKVLMKRSFRVAHKGRLPDLAKELKKLNYIQYTSATSALVRIFIEVTVRIYLTEKNSPHVSDPDSPNNKLRILIKSSLKKVEEKGLITDDEYQAAKLTINNKQESFFDEINAAVHNPSFWPSHVRLLSCWNNLQPFLQAVHKELIESEK